MKHGLSLILMNITSTKHVLLCGQDVKITILPLLTLVLGCALVFVLNRNGGSAWCGYPVVCCRL